MTDRSRVGARLRAARTAMGLTSDNVADITGLSRSFISKIERDETATSVKTLLAVCDVLSIDIGSLFARSDVNLVGSGELPQCTRVIAGRAVEHSLTPRNLGDIQVIHSVIEPGAGTGEELYSMQADVEFLYVLRGSVEVEFTNDRVIVSAGDAFTFDAFEPRSFKNPDLDNEAEALWAVVPAPWSPTARRQRTNH